MGGQKKKIKGIFDDESVDSIVKITYMCVYGNVVLIIQSIKMTVPI